MPSSVLPRARLTLLLRVAGRQGHFLRLQAGRRQLVPRCAACLLPARSQGGQGSEGGGGRGERGRQGRVGRFSVRTGVSDSLFLCHSLYPLTQSPDWGQVRESVSRQFVAGRSPRRVEDRRPDLVSPPSLSPSRDLRVSSQTYTNYNNGASCVPHCPPRALPRCSQPTRAQTDGNLPPLASAG